jgi:hypothetical protein
VASGSKSSDGGEERGGKKDWRRRRKRDLPQNQWEQLAWQGVRKRSWQTEQTSSFGGAADADEEELMPSPLAETRVAHGPPSRPPAVFLV